MVYRLVTLKSREEEMMKMATDKKELELVCVQGGDWRPHFFKIILRVPLTSPAASFRLVSTT